MQFIPKIIPHTLSHMQRNNQPNREGGITVTSIQNMIEKENHLGNMSPNVLLAFFTKLGSFD